jgi:hypothetical protein
MEKMFHFLIIKKPKDLLSFLAVIIFPLHHFIMSGYVAWNITANTLCGPLPGMSQCPGGPSTSQSWKRDAVPAEKGGFDCAKGHPANGNYHHHQNPSAFKLDRTVISTVCNLYDSDGLYVIDSTTHSPLIGFAYDGFPIYGAYAHRNTDVTGGIVRMKSGYQLRNITTRTVYADGTDVLDGLAVSTTYPLGNFREDYQSVSCNDPDVLDVHNGRICITPEYPNGTYCYLATIDANWNSAYPYVVGPTFYGVYANCKLTSITETVTTYTSAATGISEAEFNNLYINIFPNPASDLIAEQVGSLIKSDLQISLYDMLGQKLASSSISAGQTIAFFDTQTLYDGMYIITIENGQNAFSKKVVI